MAATTSSLLQPHSLKLNQCCPLRLHLPSSPPRFSKFSGNLTFQGRQFAKFNVRCCLLERKHLTGSNLNPNHFGLTSEHDIKTPIEIVSETILKVLKALKGPPIASLLLGLFLMYDPNNAALAATGGRIGGSTFSSRSSSSRSSSSSSRSYSVPSSSSSSSSKSYSRPRSSSLSSKSYSNENYEGSSFSFSSFLLPSNGGSSTFSSYSTEVSVQPTIRVGVVGAKSGFNWTVIWFVAFVFLCMILTEGGARSTADIEKTSVLKLQVGLLGTGRSLQTDLNRIAEVADTSTSEGLRFVLMETTLALLRHPGYCISGYSSVDVKQSPDDGEKCFNQLSIEERGKFDEETLVNVKNIRRRSETIKKPSGFNNEYIVITILLAAEGGHKLPIVNGSGDLKEALHKLASIPTNKIIAVEVLWTPQNENDTLSESEFFEDYPLLRPL